MPDFEKKIQDDVDNFRNSNSIGEGSSFFESNTSETDEVTFRNTLRNMVQNACNCRQKYTFQTDWNFMKFLGTYLGIDDFQTNLFSSWILRTLMEQIVTGFNDISECNYKIFICWLYQEINIVCHNPDVPREQFFGCLNKIFHQALTEILKGKGLLPLSNFIHHETKIGNVPITLGRIAPNAGVMKINIELWKCDWSRSLSDMEEEAEHIDISETSLDSQYKQHEDSLHAIIEATYRIFGDETDYLLIQYGFESQGGILHYTLPYHCRKPRMVKKAVLIEEPPIDSKIERDKSKKKSKVAKKEPIEVIEPPELSLSIDSVSILNKISSYKPEPILPLSETLEAYYAMNIDESEELETGA